MLKTKKSQLIAFSLGLVILLAGGYLYTLNPMVGGDIHIDGTITASDCATALPDQGCDITIKGWTIGLGHGFNSTPNLGTVTGYNSDSSPVGHHASVFGKKSGAHAVSIFDDAKYYIHID